jgi:hypothetical protein
VPVNDSARRAEIVLSRGILGRMVDVELRNMPTVLRKYGFVFYFYAHEPTEPPHVHVDCGGGTVKLWLNPVRVAWTADLKPAAVRQAVQLAERYEKHLVEKWHEFFRRANP